MLNKNLNNQQVISASTLPCHQSVDIYNSRLLLLSFSIANLVSGYRNPSLNPTYQQKLTQKEQPTPLNTQYRKGETFSFLFFAFTLLLHKFIHFRFVVLQLAMVNQLFNSPIFF